MDDSGCLVFGLLDSCTTEYWTNAAPVVVTLCSGCSGAGLMHNALRTGLYIASAPTHSVRKQPEGAHNLCEQRPLLVGSGRGWAKAA